MTTWIAIAGVGLGSYAFRLLPLLLGERVRWSAPIDRAIRHAGLAALTALVVAGVRHHQGDGRPGATLLAFAAVVAAAVVARRGRSMLWVVATGLGVYWVPTTLLTLWL
jgi:branched-subunit amino acid transport protein